MTPEFSFRSTLVFLFKTTSFFMIVRIVGACCSLGLLPLFTRYLTPFEYGTITIIDTIVEIFGAFCAVGLGQAVVRFYHGAVDDRQRRQVASTAMVVSGTVTICALILLAFIYSPIAFFAFKTHEYDRFVLLAVSSMLIAFPGGVAAAVLRASARVRLACTIELARIIFNVLLKIYLVVFLEQGISGVVWGYFISAVIFDISLSLWLISYVRISINRSLIRQMLRYGLPFVPTVFSSIAMHSLNRFYLNAYGSTDQVAHYQLAFQLPFALSSIILSSFESIWSSHTVFAVSRAPDALKQYSRISTYFLFFLAFVLFIVAVSANSIVGLLAAPEYAPAALYVPFIAFGLLFYAVHIFVRTGVILSKSTYLFIINYGLTLGISILFNWFLISHFGAYGAVYAAIIVYFSFSFIGGYIYNGFKYINLQRLGAVSIIWIVLVIARYQIVTISIYMDIVMAIFFTVLYLVLMLFLPFCISKEERLDIFTFIRNTVQQKINAFQYSK